MVKRACEGREEIIEIEEDNSDKLKKYFGINNIPGLIINDKLVSQGKVLTTREISKLLV